MSFAVVSRIVPDEAVGRWVLQDLSRFQRRSCKAYASGPILVAGGIQFGLLLRLGGKDLDFASDLQVYAVNLSARRTMGQHTIRVVNQSRGRDVDVLLSGEAGLWEPKTWKISSKWISARSAISHKIADTSQQAGFVVDDTLILELNMQVWEAEAVRTQGVPMCIPRPGSSMLPSSSSARSSSTIPPPSSSSSSTSRYVPPANTGGATTVAPPSASASNNSSMMRPSFIPPHSNSVIMSTPLGAHPSTANTVPPPLSLNSGHSNLASTTAQSGFQPHVPVHIAAIRPTNHSLTGALVRSAISSSKTCSLNADFSELLSTGRGADLTVTWTGLDTCAAGHCHFLPGNDTTNQESEGPDSQSIRAHRLVLGTRSPVLERLLVSSGLSESSSQSDYHTLVLDGADSRIAAWFIRFLYTDEVAAEAWEDQESLCFLLALAHKYQVQGLVDQCLARLVEQLSEETAAERLMLSDLLDAPSLKANVIDFVTASHRRLARVQATDGWQRLTKSRPELLAEILAAVVPPTKKRPRVDGK